MSASGIGTRDREVLAGLADVLIPASASMPAASEAGVTGEWLDAVLAARPDMVEPLVAILWSADGADPAAVIERLQADGSFGLLGEVVANAYYMNPAIRARIGYPLQQAVPIDPADGEDAEAEALIASVRGRGTIFRPTPGEVTTLDTG
ncbi:MAG TPA: hypothetical protein VGQ64_08965 [Candidatus Limnocylindrales bacterium]|nr:hypothetical protein [Candidatus Limnocylindrales bacterium]